MEEKDFDKVARREWRCVICNEPCKEPDVTCGSKACEAKRMDKLRELSKRMVEIEEKRRAEPVTVGMMEDYIKRFLNTD